MTPRERGKRLTLGAAVGLLASVAYRITQYISLARATVRAEDGSWQLVPFHAAWVGPYQSLFLMMALPWFLLPTWAEVKRFAAVLAGMAAVGWAIFVVHPTACVRPDPAGQPWYYAQLHALDGPNNCLPALHAALLVLTVAAIERGGGWWSRWPGRAVLAAWSAAIVLSIFGLRQHTVLDVAAGAALGGAAAWVWGRRPAGTELSRRT